MKIKSKTNKNFLVRVVVEWGKKCEDTIVRTASEAKATRNRLIEEIGASNVIDGNFCVFDDPTYGHIKGYCIVLI